MRRKLRLSSLLQITASLLCLVLCVAVAPAAAMDRSGAREPLALVSASADSLEWTPTVDSEGATLTISDPQGHVRARRFASGHVILLPLFDAGGLPLADGTYTWELRLTTRHGGSAATPLVESGYFTIAGGAVVPFDLAEAGSGKKATVAADQMVPDDVIVDGKGCIGLGCVNNEAFGAEALRLKQSVAWLRFEDTSTAAGFPGRDWQLTVNDAGAGGADRFSIEDLTAATTPFTIRGGAPNSSLYLDAVGNVGLGTATPGARLEVRGGEVRLPAGQGGVGFTHFNFLGSGINYIRGTTAIADNGGNVGIGTTTPAAKLQVSGGEVRFPPGAGAAGFTHFNLSDGKNYIRGTTIIADNAGSVGIGTTAPASKLHVNGGDIRVSGGNFVDTDPPVAPDYVFEADYELMPLAELAAFVRTEKHLPNVPKATEIKASGLNLSQFQMRLLEKIEELTLYTLAQQDQIAAQQATIAELAGKVAKLEEK